MTIKEYTQDQLAAQPIGYWAREAANLVIGGLRAALAEENLTQPHWWTLNHVTAAPAHWKRAALTEKLTPYDDQDTDFDAVYDDLAARGWLTETDGTLTLTEAGEAAGPARTTATRRCTRGCGRASTTRRTRRPSTFCGAWWPTWAAAATCRASTSARCGRP